MLQYVGCWLNFHFDIPNHPESLLPRQPKTRNYHAGMGAFAPHLKMVMAGGW